MCLAPGVEGGRSQGGEREREISSILGALAWGKGATLFQDLPVDTPKARVDSGRQVNNGYDAIEGAKGQDQRGRSKEPMFAMAQFCGCSLSVVLFPSMYPRVSGVISLSPYTILK